jgi:hypothetical protein
LGVGLAFADRLQRDAGGVAAPFGEVAFLVELLSGVFITLGTSETT